MELEKAVKPKYWHDLTEEEKRAIHNPEDYPIISFIDGIPPELRKKIYDSLKLKPEFYGEYMKEQRQWLSDFKEYWRENHHKNPTGCPEFGEDLVNCHLYERFRLYDAMKHSERFDLDKTLEVTDFLTQSRKIALLDGGAE